MEPLEGFKYYEKVMEKKTDELLFIRWVVGYQFEMSFDQFKRSMETSNRGPVKEKTEKEIYDKVMEILRKD